MKILETNKSHIIYKEDNGIVSIVPNTPYFNMKVLENKNERIKFDLPIEGIEILETFNGMIFNISLNGQTITTRPNMADAVVESFSDTDKIYKIFDDYNNNKYNLKLLKGVLEKYGDRIKTRPDGFVIDDIFLVDRTGVCWLWDNENNCRNKNHRTNLGSGAALYSILQHSIALYSIKNRVSHAAKFKRCCIYASVTKESKNNFRNKSKVTKVTFFLITNYD